MAVDLNHTIVDATDPAASAAWLSEILGLDAPARWGPFWEVPTSNGVNLDFHRHEADTNIAPQHYAFLVSEDEFDAAHARIVARGIEFYADPAGRRAGEINHHDGGRGCYFADPDGHWMEIITRPYGGGD
ncbi:MAG: VOC family protein [Acidimicrobiia bacterium]|nr:VOC family protein [Acidimicrobiia bacterium]